MSQWSIQSKKTFYKGNFIWKMKSQTVGGFFKTLPKPEQKRHNASVDLPQKLKKVFVYCLLPKCQYKALNSQ